MESSSPEQHRYFPDIDPALPDEQRAWKLKEAMDWFDYYTRDKDSDEIALSPEDEKALHRYAEDPSPQVRAVAISYLCKQGPITWDDLDKWVLDSDKDIRDHVVWALRDSSEAAGRLCATDKPRCVGLLAAVAERYDDYAAGIELLGLSQNAEWLPVVWPAVVQLLDHSSPDLAEMLTCTYFEHVIPDRDWGPDDPHIRPWIEGKDRERKKVLLRIANYCGLDEGRLRDIVKALACSSDGRIAQIARGILDGTVKPRALW